MWLLAPSLVHFRIINKVLEKSKSKRYKVLDVSIY